MPRPMFFSGSWVSSASVDMPSKPRNDSAANGDAGGDEVRVDLAWLVDRIEHERASAAAAHA